MSDERTLEEGMAAATGTGAAATASRVPAVSGAGSGKARGVSRGPVGVVLEQGAMSPPRTPQPTRSTTVRH